MFTTNTNCHEPIVTAHGSYVLVIFYGITGFIYPEHIPACTRLSEAPHTIHLNILLQNYKALCQSVIS